MYTELEIARAMLAANGTMAPGHSTLETNHPDMQSALQLIQSVNKAFQVRGWWFNREHNVMLTPNDEHEIILPEGVLSYERFFMTQDAMQPVERMRFVQRTGKLYDTFNSTFKIKSALRADLITLLAVTDLPASAGVFLQARCVMEYYENDDGDLNKAERLKDRMQTAYNTLYSEELRSGGVSALDAPAAAGIRSRIHGGRFGADSRMLGGGIYT